MRAITGLSVALALVAGCGTKEVSPAAKQVTVAELGKETDHLIFFNYVGSDTEFHHFTTAESKRYKVLRSEWNTPRTFPLEGGMQLFMPVKNDKLTVPNPKEMAGRSEDDLLHRPYRKKQP